MSSLQGESILAMTYGYQVHGSNDWLLVASQRRNEFSNATILPGAVLVNHIPLCMNFLLLHISNMTDSTHMHQYATSQSGYHGLATSHKHVLAMNWEIRSCILQFNL